MITNKEIENSMEVYCKNCIHSEDTLYHTAYFPLTCCWCGSTIPALELFAIQTEENKNNCNSL